MEWRPRQFSLWYFLVALLILVAIPNTRFAAQMESLSYGDFKALVRAGKVSDLSLNPRAISGKLKLEGPEGLLP